MVSFPCIRIDVDIDWNHKNSNYCTRNIESNFSKIDSNQTSSCCQISWRFIHRTEFDSIPSALNRIETYTSLYIQLLHTSRHHTYRVTNKTFAGQTDHWPSTHYTNTTRESIFLPFQKSHNEDIHVIHSIATSKVRSSTLHCCTRYRYLLRNNHLENPKLPK